MGCTLTPIIGVKARTTAIVRTFATYAVANVDMIAAAET